MSNATQSLGLDLRAPNDEHAADAAEDGADQGDQANDQAGSSARGA